MPAQVGHNLQILQFETKGELKLYMETISENLGVECVFCHAMRDKSSDEKEHKPMARNMIKMTMDINSSYLNWEGAEKVTCWTCHQGYKEPPKKE